MNSCKICGKEVTNKKRIYCSNTCKFSDKDYNKSRVDKNKNPDDKILVCKITGKRILDFFNKSGIVSRHLKTIGIEFDRDSYLNHFHLIEEVSVYLQCPICTWKTTDTDNKSGCFTNHLNNIHQLSISTFLETNPSYSFLCKTQQNKDNRIKLINQSLQNHVTCKICNENHKILSNSHLKLHGITQEDYKLKYGEIISKTTQQLFSKNLSDASDKIEYTSKAETELYNFLLNIGIQEFDIIKNSKSIIHPYQIDLYIKSLKVGIEYNGLYWHSERTGNRDKNYHANKTNIAIKNNIHLIQIFEDEWNNKKEIIKNKLKSILHKFSSSDKVIYARMCEIRSVNKNDKSTFLNKTHIQGNDKSTICYGLYFKNEPVNIVTFSKLRNSLGYKNKMSGVYEVVRYSSQTDTRVIGGFGKLLKHFIKVHSPIKLISYADRRYSNQFKNLYNSTGFKLVSITKPNYFYIYNGKRLHRYNFTKDKILKLFKNSDVSKTEVDIMFENGYDRIWDCGNLKYELSV